jgi:hypothetical protein
MNLTEGGLLNQRYGVMKVKYQSSLRLLNRMQATDFDSIFLWIFEAVETSTLLWPP